MNLTQRAVVLLVGGVVCLYDLWAVRAVDNGFKWELPQGGYYNQLAQAFTSGHLYLAMQPDPRLLAATNPWDASLPDDWKMHDMVLFNRRYFLYHGAAPAVLLFAPWRLLTHRDLPEKFGLFLFCFAGFVFACAAMLRLLRVSDARPPAWLLGLMVLALRVCQGVPFLLSRTWVYELAIASGYCCVMAGMWMLARSLTGADQRWLCAAGVAFGAAVAGRPHLALCGIIAVLCLRNARRMALFAGGFAAVAGAIAWYNYARFGNPLEFGVRYLLTGPNQNQLDLHVRNWVPGFFYNVLAWPHFGPVFPWVRAVMRYPYDTPEVALPKHYFVEPTVGLLWLAPLAAVGLLAWRGKMLPEVRTCLRVVLLSATAVLWFLMTTHMTAQRYLVDYAPLFVLAGVTAVGLAGRGWLAILFAASVLYGATVNLALGIAGPYDDLRHTRPARYAAIASRLSFGDAVRLRMNPALRLELAVTMGRRRPGTREPLVRIGPQEYRLDLEYTADGAKLVSEDQVRDIGKAEHFTVGLVTQGGRLRVLLDGAPAFDHEFANRVIAPAEVTTGTNIFEANTQRRFAGTIEVLRRDFQ